MARYSTVTHWPSAPRQATRSPSRLAPAGDSTDVGGIAKREQMLSADVRIDQPHTCPGKGYG